MDRFRVCWVTIDFGVDIFARRYSGGMEIYVVTQSIGLGKNKNKKMVSRAIDN